jgi:UDP-N-acetylglucosamine acyltransferase
VPIHPSAVIHPDAKIGTDVKIGPGAIVGAEVEIGDRCEIQAHAVLESRVVLGSDNLIGYGAIIGADPQDFAFRPQVRSEVRIGNGNRIREYVTIHRGTAEGTATVVGNECFLMGGTHLAHNVCLGDHVITANNVLLGGHVIVEDRVFIGGGSVFHQHIRVGRLVICQGKSGFSKDIPPFVIAAERNGVAGLNVIGLRRAGLTPAERAGIKEAFDLLYREGLNVSQAVAAAKERVWTGEARAFWEFVGESRKKGLVDLLANRSRQREQSE